jgi:hypothetical protein
MADERVESEGFFEMLWDCPHCDTKGLLGKSQRHCPECGAPQDETKRYMPSPEQQKAVPGHVYVGADRKCTACGAPQSALAKNCTQCGAPLEGAAEVAEASAPPAAAAPTAAPGSAVPATGLDVPDPPRPRRSVLVKLLAVALLGFALFALWWQFLRTKHADVTVAGHAWVAKIGIDEYDHHTHSAWRNSVPASANGVSCTRKTRSTRQVPDGESCHTERHDKKDGTFEQTRVCSPKTRSEDVDDDWCSYDVLDWSEVSADTARGNDLTPRWPEPTVPALADAYPGHRRQGARTMTLTLQFAGGDSCDVSDAVWHKYKDHDVVRLTVRARSGGVVCGDL